MASDCNFADHNTHPELEKEDQSDGRCGSVSDTSTSLASYDSNFGCNICLESPRDHVASLCGHPYCWPCIYKWIHFNSMDNENSDHPPQCPWQSGSFSCSIVPLYGRSRDPDMISYERDALNWVRRIPQRPPPPTCQEISPVSFGGLQQTPEVHHTHGSSYASSSLLRLGSINFLHPIIEIFAEMVSSRMSGPSVTNRYAYDHSSSFSTATAHTPRARRQLMRADQSLIRLCLFFCCMILCLLMF